MAGWGSEGQICEGPEVGQGARGDQNEQTDGKERSCQKGMWKRHRLSCSSPMGGLRDRGPARGKSGAARRQSASAPSEPRRITEVAGADLAAFSQALCTDPNFSSFIILYHLLYYTNQRTCFQNEPEATGKGAAPEI